MGYERERKWRVEMVGGMRKNGGRRRRSKEEEKERKRRIDERGKERMQTDREVDGGGWSPEYRWREMVLGGGKQERKNREKGEEKWEEGRRKEGKSLRFFREGLGELQKFRRIWL